MLAEEFLYKYYSEHGNSDSAFAYLLNYNLLRDSVFNEHKLRQIQNISFAENEREREIQAYLKEEQQSRRSNLQMAAIAAFIPLFFGLILFLSKQRLKKNHIETLALIGLLFMFEFISLLLHPMVSHVTGHSPVFMILILVIIAYFIIPFHKKTEKFIFQKLGSHSVTTHQAKMDEK